MLAVKFHFDPAGMAAVHGNNMIKPKVMKSSGAPKLLLKQSEA